MPCVCMLVKITSEPEASINAIHLTAKTHNTPISIEISVKTSPSTQQYALGKLVCCSIQMAPLNITAAIS